VNVLIIGNCVGHRVQEAQIEDDPLASEKKHFENLLRSEILRFRVEFIGEEALEGSETIAKHLGIPWANIDMPQAIRGAKGIANEQSTRPRIPTYIGPGARNELTEAGYQIVQGGGWVVLEPRLPSDIVREEYMFDRAVREAARLKSIMVICGVNHLLELQRRFRSKYGDQVEVKLWQGAR